MKSHDDIIAHMAKNFGPVRELALVEVVPTLKIAINIIPPRSEQDPIIAFTTGMSDEAQSVPPDADEYRYTELFFRLPRNWPTSEPEWRDDKYFWPYRWLRQLAAYPHENETWLGGQYPIISNGEPPESLGPNTELSCLLLLRELGEAGTVSCRDGRRIALYSVVPLYVEERDLERTQGIRGLFGALQAKKISFVLNPARPNAAIGE